MAGGGGKVRALRPWESALGHFIYYYPRAGRVEWLSALILLPVAEYREARTAAKGRESRRERMQPAC